MARESSSWPPAGRYGWPPTHGPVASSPTRKTVRLSMRDHPGPDECCKVLAEGAPGIRSCRFSARMAQQGAEHDGAAVVTVAQVDQGLPGGAGQGGGVLGAQVQVAAAQGMAVRAQPGQEGRERLVEAVPGGLQD